MNGSPLGKRSSVKAQKGRSVALQPRTVQEITLLEDDLAEVVSELRKIRVKMTESALDTVELETEKAEGFIRYLKEDWVGKCAQRVRRAEVQKQSKAVRERVKGIKSGSK